MSASASILKKSPGAMNGAPRQVDGHRAAQARPDNAAHTSGRTPLSARGTIFAPGTKFAPLTEKKVAEELEIALADYSAGQIAQTAQCTKDTAKSWKKGARAPNSAHLLNMLALPRVVDCVEAMTGMRISRPNADVINHHTVTGLIAALQIAGQLPGEDGAQARAILDALTRGPS